MTAATSSADGKNSTGYCLRKLYISVLLKILNFINKMNSKYLKAVGKAHVQKILIVYLFIHAVEHNA
jgi:hypothetical protein